MGRGVNDNGDVFFVPLPHSRHLLSALSRSETELEWVDVHSIGAWVSRLGHGRHTRISSACECPVQWPWTGLWELQSSLSWAETLEMGRESADTYVHATNPPMRYCTFFSDLFLFSGDVSFCLLFIIALVIGRNISRNWAVIQLVQ